MYTSRSILSLVLIFYMTSSIAFSQKPTGATKEKVVNTETKEPAIGINILLLDTKLGTTTDSVGRFIITDIPVGSYRVAFQNVGFARMVQPDVIIRPDCITFINAELQEQLIVSDQFDVQAEYFRNDELSPLSSVSLNYEEVRRAPGSAGDVSHVLMSLPSVGQFNHNANDLVVRGGSPSENGFYVDGIQKYNRRSTREYHTCCLF
jgi:hypothetical protein